MKKPRARVAVLMGSASDANVMSGCTETLKAFGVPYTAKVLSAHRVPRETSRFVEGAKAKGVEVIIAAAGGAAHLAGVCAAHTDLPVIGVPIEGPSLKGLDSLLATVQMPSGVPVGCVAIGRTGAKNSAFLALRILALKDARIAGRLKSHQASTKKKILKTVLDL